MSRGRIPEGEWAASCPDISLDQVVRLLTLLASCAGWEKPFFSPGDSFRAILLASLNEYAFEELNIDLCSQGYRPLSAEDIDDFYTCESFVRDAAEGWSSVGCERHQIRERG